MTRPGPLVISLLSLAVACSSSSSSSPPGGDTKGCGTTTLLANPADLAAPGPWPVGVKTVTVDGLTTEIWYPAMPGSDAGKTPARYDIRLELPATEAAKIPDADNPWQDCHCTRDLPLDTAHGPYPVVVFVHGTASFRNQSLPIVTHWASRGFVVIAADHPGLKLGDLLSMACGGSPPAQNLSGNIDSLIAAIGAPAGDLAFLAGHVDATRLAIAGHSAGASAAASASTKPGVQVVISMAGNQATSSASSLYMAGTADQIVSQGQVMTAYNGAAKPRRFLSIQDGGHLTFSDLCQTKNAAGMDMLQVANQYMVCGANLAGFLFDCNPDHIDGQSGWDIIDYASSAVLENTLQCQSSVSPSGIKGVYPKVADYEEAL